jgi:hypothetical protein
MCTYLKNKYVLRACNQGDLQLRTLKLGYFVIGTFCSWGILKPGMLIVCYIWYVKSFVVVGTYAAWDVLFCI